MNNKPFKKRKPKHNFKATNIPALLESGKISAWGYTKGSQYGNYTANDRPLNINESEAFRGFM